jgi:hypothetical protein
MYRVYSKLKKRYYLGSFKFVALPLLSSFSGHKDNIYASFYNCTQLKNCSACLLHASSLFLRVPNRFFLTWLPAGSTGIDVERLACGVAKMEIPTY